MRTVSAPPTSAPFGMPCSFKWPLKHPNPLKMSSRINLDSLAPAVNSFIFPRLGNFPFASRALTETFGLLLVPGDFSIKMTINRNKKLKTAKSFEYRLLRILRINRYGQTWLNEWSRGVIFRFFDCKLVSGDGKLNRMIAGERSRPGYLELSPSMTTNRHA